MTVPIRPGQLGLRAQILLALVTVLVISGGLALLAVGRLSVIEQRRARLPTALVLSRAVAGRAASLTHDPAALVELLDGAVGRGALTGAAYVDEQGIRVARAGSLVNPFPDPPLRDRTSFLGDRIVLVISVPGRGALVSETSIAPTASERALGTGVLLYTFVAGLVALLAVYVLLTRYTLRPVLALTQAAERTAEGRRTVIRDVRGAAEIQRATLAFNSMIGQLEQREQELSARVSQLETTTQALAATQAQLVQTEKLAVVGRLAAGLAHEIGNPLAAIVGLTEVLRDGGLPDAEVQDFAGRIGKEADRIHRTLRDLLDYARATPDASENAVGEVGSVQEAALQVQRLLAPQRAMRDVRLVCALDDSLPPVPVHVDRVVQILLNLVLNAADAARPGSSPGGTATITIRAVGDGDHVRIEVEDDGPGIEPALRARVFEPFFTTKPAGQGTGLGLAICASIVEQAGGTIAAVDRVDGRPGACIRITLPLHRPMRPSLPG